MQRGNAILLALAGMFGLVGLVCAAAEPTVEAPRLTIPMPGTFDGRASVVTALAVQPDGDLLATAGDDHVVRLWDLKTGRPGRQLTGHGDWITSLVFSPDGGTLYSGGHDGLVLAWNATGEMAGRFADFDRPITALSVCPQSGNVAAVGFRGRLRLFSANTGQLIRSTSCPCADMRCIRFSPDSSYLAGAGRNGRVRIWDPRRRTHRDIQAHDRRVHAITFTANNERLLTAGDDQCIRVWDLAAGVQLQQLPCRSAKVLALAMVGPKQVAAACTDNRIRLFQLDHPSPSKILQGHTGSVTTLAARGDQLISGSFDTTVRIWPLGATRAVAENLAATRTGIEP